MKRILTTILLISSGSLLAQQTSGTIKYDETIQFNIDFGDHGPQSEEIKAMMPKSSTTQKVLHFSAEHTLYKDDEQKKKGDETIKHESGEVEIMMVMKRPDNAVYQNLEKASIVDKREFMDRIFLITDKAEKSSWKITGEQKEILGYQCQKATTVRDSSSIEAWFTAQIPISSGPANYGGLPGLILEVNRDQGESVITAKEVIFDQNAASLIIPPKKGKQVSRTEFAKIREEKMKERKIQYGGKGNRVFIQKN